MFDCGCKINIDTRKADNQNIWGFVLQQCPLHEAAPDLLAAAKVAKARMEAIPSVRNAWINPDAWIGSPEYTQLDAAMQKAEPAAAARPEAPDRDEDCSPPREYVDA